MVSTGQEANIDNARIAAEVAFALILVTIPGLIITRSTALFWNVYENLQLIYALMFFYFDYSINVFKVIRVLHPINWIDFPYDTAKLIFEPTNLEREE